MADPDCGDCDDESWSSGYIPDRDLYGGYLSWHALMLVAGELLAKRPVVGEHWEAEVLPLELGSGPATTCTENSRSAEHWQVLAIVELLQV